MTTQHCIIFPLVTMGVLVLTRDVQSDWIANRDLKKGCPYPLQAIRCASALCHCYAYCPFGGIVIKQILF